MAKKAKAKAAAANAASASGGPDASEPVEPAKPLETVSESNRKHLEKLEQSLQTILGHHLFQNIMHESPPEIVKTAEAHEGGMQAWFPKCLHPLTWPHYVLVLFWGNTFSVKVRPAIN